MAMEMGLFAAFVILMSIQAKDAQACQGNPYGQGCDPTNTAKSTVSAAMLGVNCLPLFFGILVGIALCCKVRQVGTLEDDDDFHRDEGIEMK